jgi:FtsZ-binding cell division protein ZapB
MIIPFRASLLAAAALVVVVGAYSGWRAIRTHQAAVHLKKADQLDTTQATHGAKAETHEQEAQALTPTLQEDDAAVARARAAVDRLAVLHSGSAAHSTAPAGDATPQPVHAPVVVAPLDAAKDVLISALTKDVADLKAANASLAQADQERQAQVKDLKAEVVQLRASIAARPPELRWAVLGIYGTNQSAGASVEYDRGAFRAGLDVVRRQVSGGQSTVEALGRVGMRF